MEPDDGASSTALLGSDALTLTTRPCCRPSAFAASTESIMKTPELSSPLVTIAVMERPFSRLTTSIEVFRGKELHAA
jgi:hypothetical protein